MNLLELELPKPSAANIYAIVNELQALSNRPKVQVVKPYCTLGSPDDASIKKENHTRGNEGNHYSWLVDAISFLSRHSEMPNADMMLQKVSCLISSSCGRSASGPISKHWIFPSVSLRLNIQEPSFVDADVGSLIWGSAVVLARVLLTYPLSFFTKIPPHLADEPLKQPPAIIDNKLNCTILELGCGVGMIGLLLAHLYPNSQVTMTDGHAKVVEAAMHNLATNARGSNCEVTLLDWYSMDASIADLHFFDVIVAADIAYNKEDAAAVARVVDLLLSNLHHSTFICVLPIRKGYEMEFQHFQDCMAAIVTMKLVWSQSYVEDNSHANFDVENGGQVGRFECFVYARVAVERESNNFVH